MKSCCRIALLAMAIAIVWIYAGFECPAHAAGIPEDQPGFTEYIAHALEKAMASAKISVVGPMVLDIDSPTGGKHQGNVQTPYAQCRAIPDQCNLIVSTWIAQMSAVFSKAEKPLDRASLRIVLRPAAYVDQLRRTQKQEPVAAAFMSGLWMICVADLPTAIDFPPARQFEALGLSPQAALALCKANTAATLRPIAVATKGNRAKKIGYITGDPYESSRFLMPELWKPLADRGKGQLIVAVPGSDVVIYKQASDQASIDALRQEARMVMTRAARAISPAVFLWTPTGFREIEP